MIKIENVETCNWRAAVRGCRNPLESWAKSDSYFYNCETDFYETINGKKEGRYETAAFDIGPNDLDLMKRLANAGTDHSKFMRMITVSFDIVAPLYFWKEFDTYKIGVVRNSCSTMHKIEARPLTLEDFATDDLLKSDIEICLKPTIDFINELIFMYTELGLCHDSRASIHRRIVKLLPDSYLQRATITTNYQVLRSIRNSDRKTHKLICWHEFCDFIDTLPYAKELLIKEEKVEKEYNEALKGIKTYAEKKDSCAGLTCCNVDKENDVRYRCDKLSHTYNVPEGYHYYECALKGTGVAIPDKDIVNGLLIEPGAFNGEEF